MTKDKGRKWKQWSSCQGLNESEVDKNLCISCSDLAVAKNGAWQHHLLDDLHQNNQTSIHIKE